jgi:hypothetical protein
MDSNMPLYTLEMMIPFVTKHNAIPIPNALLRFASLSEVQEPF